MSSASAPTKTAEQKWLATEDWFPEDYIINEQFKPQYAQKGAFYAYMRVDQSKSWFRPKRWFLLLATFIGALVVMPMVAGVWGIIGGALLTLAFAYCVGHSSGFFKLIKRIIEMRKNPQDAQNQDPRKKIYLYARLFIVSAALGFGIYAVIASLATGALIGSAANTVLFGLLTMTAMVGVACVLSAFLVPVIQTLITILWPTARDETTLEQQEKKSGLKEDKLTATRDASKVVTWFVSEKGEFVPTQSSISVTSEPSVTGQSTVADADQTQDAEGLHQAQMQAIGEMLAQQVAKAYAKHSTSYVAMTDCLVDNHQSIVDKAVQKFLAPIKSQNVMNFDTLFCSANTDNSVQSIQVGDIHVSRRDVRFFSSSDKPKRVYSVGNVDLMPAVFIGKTEETTTTTAYNM